MRAVSGVEWSRVRLRALTGSDSVQMKSMIGTTLRIIAVCWDYSML